MDTTLDAVNAFAVTLTTEGRDAIISPSGALTHETCAELTVSLEQVLPQGTPSVILDCRQVKAMDSNALELLLEWHEKLHSMGGSLKLCDLNDVCSDILIATRLVHIFSVYDDVKHAVQRGRR
jgi:anti-anti-sigma factor